jgi:hypothetical protein
MIGSGIASSLIHEVGHQGAALLGLVPSLQAVLRAKQRDAPEPIVWQLWERWTSEIVSDFWSIARVGVVSTLWLMGVVSLPRPFVFRLNFDDPHPTPWIRVMLSCAIGDSLYPHAQWRKVAKLWEAYYPMADLDQERRDLLARLESTFPEFVSVLIEHRPASLRGRTLGEALQTNERTPNRLTALFSDWNKKPSQMYHARPSLVFAVLGQAKVDGSLSPENESDLLAKLLTYWATRSTLDASAYCAAVPKSQVRAPAIQMT